MCVCVCVWEIGSSFTVEKTVMLTKINMTNLENAIIIVPYNNGKWNRIQLNKTILLIQRSYTHYV